MTETCNSGPQVGRIGVELEVFCSQDGRLIGDLTDCLPDEGSFGEHGRVTVDAGIGCAELIPPPCRSVEELGTKLRELCSCLPAEWEVSYSPRNPHLNGSNPSEEWWNDKPRYRALIAAARQEMPESWESIHQMTVWGATHITLEIAPFSEAGVKLMNFLNHIAPYFTDAVCRKFGINNAGHLRIWKGFARPERLPGYRWFGTPTEFKRFFEGLSAFIQCEGGKDDGWTVGSNVRQKIGNPIHEGTFWHFARPKLQFENSENGCPGCIEFRPLPTMTPNQVEWVAGLVLGLSNAFLRESWGVPLPTVESLEPVLKKLAADERFEGFIPPRPLAESEWIRLFHS